MQFDVLLTRESKNGYSARPVLMPELIVSGDSEEEALSRVRTAIADAQVESRIVRIEVPAADVPMENSWLRFAGEWGDESDWNGFLSGVQSYRDSFDKSVCPELPTCR
jgi:hypothetical protein